MAKAKQSKRGRKAAKRMETKAAAVPTAAAALKQVFASDHLFGSQVYCLAWNTITGKLFFPNPDSIESGMMVLVQKYYSKRKARYNACAVMKTAQGYTVRATIADASKTEFRKFYKRYAMPLSNDNPHDNDGGDNDADLF